jgi:hypothetical protein
MSLVLADQPTERSVYEDLTIEQQEAFLDGIRERRLASLKVYEELQAAKAQVRNEKLSAKAERLSKKVGKQLEAALKAITAVEQCHREIRAIKIEMESST